MRVLHISTSDAGGGAARAAYRLHAGLRTLGVDSHMVVAKATSGDPTCRKVTVHGGLGAKLWRRRRRKAVDRDWAAVKPGLPAGFEWFSDDRTEVGRDLARTVVESGPWDVVNLHWTGGLLDWGAFFASPAAAVPLVWRLADMGAITGGCHYDGGCGRFHNVCGACPVLGSSVDDDLSRHVWQRRHAALAHVPSDGLTVVGPSRWIAAQSRRSSLFSRFPTTVIPNGLDAESFAPRDQRFARDLLGVPAEARVVLFVAESTENKRKGFAELLDAIDRLADVPGLLLLSVGGQAPRLPDGVANRHLGRVTADRLLSAAYAAADVFVIPSLQESFGQTVTEAMACGTPVVGFDAGGIPDMVRPGVTGQLAPVGDTAALAAAVRTVLADPDRAAMGRRCRQVALDEYTVGLQAERYAALYQSLAERRG